MSHLHSCIPVFTTSYKNADNPSIVAYLVKGRGSAYDKLERSVTQIVEELLSKIDGPAENREEPVSINFLQKP